MPQLWLMRMRTALRIARFQPISSAQQPPLHNTAGLCKTLSGLRPFVRAPKQLDSGAQRQQAAMAAVAEAGMMQPSKAQVALVQLTSTSDTASNFDACERYIWVWSHKHLCLCSILECHCAVRCSVGVTCCLAKFRHATMLAKGTTHMQWYA